MNIFTNFHKRLIKIKDSEPLNALSFILILFLDIFILVNIFIGLDNQTDQLTSPEEYIPSICRNIIIQDEWVEENKIEKLSDIVLNQYRSYYYIDEDIKPKHPICTDILSQLDKLKKDEKLIALFTDRDKLETKYDSYDNFQKNNNLKVKLILDQIKITDEQINQNKEVENFWKILQEKEKLSKELTEDLRKANFIFPIKRLFFQFLFLIPLLIGFIFWFSKSAKKNRPLQTFISSHLLVVALVPIFFEVCHAIFEIIPNHILKNFIKLLKSLNLIAIWHYILVVVAILVTLLLVFLIQKKVFNKERLIKKRFNKKQCIECGKKLFGDMKHCPYCGYNQKIICSSCKKETYAGGDNCVNCGDKLSKEK